MNKDPPKSLFVTNLPYSLDFEDFKSYFTKFGPVERFDIPDHPAKPIAFVHFENSDDAAKCLKENNGILYHGKILRIKYSSKAKPENPPPLPSSVRTEADTSSNAHVSDTNKVNLDSLSNHKEHERLVHSPPERHSHKARYESIHHSWESRRRDISPSYEVERRHDRYNKYDYIDRVRERDHYRDRIDRGPPLIRDRERDYYNDQYEYDHYSYRRPSGNYREREIGHEFHERDPRGLNDRDFYDYQYNQSSVQPISQTHQIPQQPLPRTLAYPVNQNSPVLIPTHPSAASIQPTMANSITQQQVNELVRVAPRSNIIRSQIPASSQIQTPPRLHQEQPPPPSSIQQSQPPQYEYDGNRYYSPYR